MMNHGSVLLAGEYRGLGLDRGGPAWVRALSKWGKRCAAQSRLAFLLSTLSMFDFRDCANCTPAPVHTGCSTTTSYKEEEMSLFVSFPEGSLGWDTFQQQSPFNYFLSHQAAPQGCLTPRTSLMLTLSGLLSPPSAPHPSLQDQSLSLTVMT